MTRLQWMDAALATLCLAIAPVAWFAGWPMLPAWSWVASALFCACSAWFCWADRLWVRLRPVYLRLFVVWRLR